MVSEDYKVRLDVFEGPLDLLLFLIKQEEVDVYNIPIETITKQYMEYLNLMRMLDLNIAGEFIVMAATLMMIKSRMLLPVDERPELEQEEEDPRWDLVRQLVEYKRFKDAALRLEERERRQANAFARGDDGRRPEPEHAGVELEDISLFQLITAFNAALKRARPEEIGEIMADRFTVADQIEVVLRRVDRGGPVRFSELFPGRAPRSQIICTFLALLELLRLRQVTARQDRHFGEIVLETGEERQPAAAAAPPAVEATHV